MDSAQKQESSCSESSSDQLEQLEATKEDANNYSESFIKRSYECIFCKRGFTNAQALGGHMNIHRKDRPNKPPKTTTFSSSSSSSIQSNQIIGQSTFNNIPYFAPLLGKSQMNYQASASNLLGGFNMNLWGSDLSLQIGQTVTTTTTRRRLWNGEAGVDLELRLGHHP